MPNYQEGKIYKIYNTINDDFYVGSTTQKLCERMREHRSNSRSNKLENMLIYKAFGELGVEKFYIELIEKCPCNDKDELRKKEGEWIRQLKPSLNKYIAGRTQKEYRYDNRDIILSKRKEWRENNKDHTAQGHKKWREENKEYIQKRNGEKARWTCARCQGRE